jgi:Tfp pilus assembly protein PilP
VPMMRSIPKNNKVIFPLLTGLCLLLCFMMGCKEEAPPVKPVVVSKRIEPAPQKKSPEKKSAPSVKETTSAPAQVTKETTPLSTQAATPDTKAVPQTETVKADPSTTKEEAAEKYADSQPSGSEQPSLRSSLPDTSPLYDPTGKIDPFAPLFSEDRGSADDSMDSKPKRPLTPLEKIDLSQLQLVAILRTQNGNKAMVEDATGKGYVLTPGTFIGINSGKVKQILRDRVVVEETKKDFLGKQTIDTRELKLQKPFGEE